MADLNPSFTFDFGGGGGQADVQAPWEFSGALAQAEKDVGASNATTIDHKIAALLQRNKRVASWKPPAPVAKGGRKRQAAAAAAASDSDSDGEGSSRSGSDEDKPLPGEVDEEDSESEDDGEGGLDLDLGEWDSGEEEEEEEEEKVAIGKQQQRRQQRGKGSRQEQSEEEEEEEEGSEDEIARAGMELDLDQLGSSSEEEQEEEEDEESEEEEEQETWRQQQEVAAPVGKRKREQQAAAQQAQQAQQAEAQRPRRGAAAGVADGGGTVQRQDGAGGQEAGVAGKRRKGGFFDATPTDTKFAAKSFEDLGLSRPLLKACEVLGYAHPTPIQAACLPLAMAGRDICGSAVTGSGKTAAFGLPLLERLLHRDKRVASTYVLVLTPVRELAVQVHSMLQKLAQFTDIQACLVVGGLSLQAQAAALRAQPEIVVATPGRMIDHLRNTQSVGLEDLEVLVLDEADRLLEMGFADEINEVVRLAPTRRQTMLFSATMTEEVKKLVALSLKQPVRLAADAAAMVPKELSQEIVRLKGAAAAQKEAVLLSLCSRAFKAGRAIIFARTKAQAHRLKMLFGLAGLPTAGELHGDMTQAARLESLDKFRKGEVAFLLATELAARGLDILGVETVINYDAPTQLSSYLHRVGRTARAGAQGRAVTFISDSDRQLLKQVMKKTGVAMQQRAVPAAEVASWQAKVESLEGQVRELVSEEKEERALREAEMEANKASNLLEHHDEIMARPPRTWFQTEKQKKEAAKAAKEAAANGFALDGGDGEAEGGEASNPAQRSKVKSEKRLEQKQQRAKEAKEAAKKRSNKLMEETAGASRTIRAVKAKEQQLRLEGVTSGRAGKMAPSLVTGVKKTKKKKGKDGGRELFDGDGLPSRPGSGGKSSAKVYAGGARSGAVKPPPSRKLGKSELNKVKRGGKGKHGFKTKARHKRR